MAVVKLARGTASRILFVGEAPGKDEEILGAPFVGAAGQEMTRMLRDAKIDRGEVSFTNLLTERPGRIYQRWNPQAIVLDKELNNIDLVCVAKPEIVGQPALRPARYLQPALAEESLARLALEVQEVRPNLVVALGATALWALCGETRITKLRGAIRPSTLVPGVKVLPTFHPAYIIRNWSDRVIAIADLMKAARESLFPEIRRQRREIWLDPTLEDLQAWGERFLDPFRGRPEDLLLSTDVETPRGAIACVGFSTGADNALVVPFQDERKSDYSYWPTLSDEVRAWRWVQGALEFGFTLCGQNILYDIQHFFRPLKIRPRHVVHDSMFIHHAAFPELPKDLGFLGSIYTNEPAWKLYRPRGRHLEKRDE